MLVGMRKKRRTWPFSPSLTHSSVRHVTMSRSGGLTHAGNPPRESTCHGPVACDSLPLNVSVVGLSRERRMEEESSS